MHVISGGKSISVVTLGKREFAVASAQIDEEHDLALLQVPEAIKVDALPLGNSCIFRWSGRMPYLIGPKSAAMTPRPKSAA